MFNFQSDWDSEPEGRLPAPSRAAGLWSHGIFESPHNMALHFRCWWFPERCVYYRCAEIP